MLTRPLATLALLTFLIPTAAAQRWTLKDLKGRLADRDASARKEAHAALDDDRAQHLRSAGLAEVARLRRLDVRAYETARRALQGLLPGLASARARKALSARVQRWAKVREEAYRRVFDETAYPSPGPKNVIRGPWKGYNRAVPALRRAERAFDVVAGPLRKALDALGDAEAQAARLDALRTLAARITERDAVLTAHRKTVKPQPALDLAMFERARLLAAGKPAEAVKGLDALAEPDRAVLFVLYGEGILRANRAVELKVSGAARDATDRIGRMRMALTILPAEVNAILTTAIRGHLEEMRAKRFFSHYSPDPRRKTWMERCRLAGWKGSGTGENLSTAGPLKSIEIWLWDGGHARNLVRPNYPWIGLDHVGSTGMNIGRGVETRWPRPTFYDLPELAKPTKR